MNQAEENWARLGAAVAGDAALASYADGALLLWDAADGRPGHLNAAARALLGNEPSLPPATLQRFALLAGGLAPRNAVRLERLRLASGFAATMVTCGCMLTSDADGAPVLAIAIGPSELRRLGISVPAPETQTAAPEPEPAPATPSSEEPAPASPKRALVRFLWQSDVAGILTKTSPDLAEAIGTDAAAALPGRNWADLAASDVHDPEGKLAALLAKPATWSGHSVLWRVGASEEGVRIELSGVPVLDAGRQLAGFRGFGLARPLEREAFPLNGAAIASGAEPLPDSIAAEADGTPAKPSDNEAALAEPDSLMPDAGIESDTIAVTAEAAAGTGDTDVQAVATRVETAAGDETPPAPPVVEAPAPVIARTVERPHSPGANIVPLRNGHLTAVRPMLEPSKPNLSSAERNAFREIAKALGARIAGEDEIAPPPTPAVPSRPEEESREPSAPAPEPQQPVAEQAGATSAPPAAVAMLPAARMRLPNSHADVLDRLPVAVLVNRGDAALYANRTLLDLLDYADLDDLVAGGGVSRLIKEAARADGGSMILIDRLSRLVSVEATISTVSWQGEPATLMAFRHSIGGEVRLLSAEEAEEAELAAEFEAEDAESAARIEALRLDVDVREGRIAELVAMLDTATDGVVTVDERGRVLSLNKTAEALFGYDQREVTGELFTLLFSAESHAPALDYLEGLKGGGVASVMNDGREVIGRVRQGGKIPLFMTMGQIADGSDRRYCAVLRDITAWKKTEGELVEARKAAEKASAQKSDVLAKISHEIRTPLNAIIGFAEVMAEERFGPIGNERYKEYLRDIHQSGGYVISLVNDLLDLAKIEAGKLDLDFESVNLNEIALSAVSLLQPEAQRGRVVLRSGLSPKLPPVVADQRSIRQIVINLLSNAVKFTDAGGQVIVSTALGDQGEAILRVRDTGIGMDDSEIALALEPFRQVPTTRRKGGTGLGLPLTKALVEANRAAMTITSVKKEGTLVEITFPPQRVLAG
jgi:PAS domain S-box-containing protein